MRIYQFLSLSEIGFSQKTCVSYQTLYNGLIIQWFNEFINKLPHYPITPLHHYIITSLYHYTITSLHHYTITPLHHYTITSLHH
jgi:hypothetical protein